MSVGKQPISERRRGVIISTPHSGSVALEFRSRPRFIMVLFSSSRQMIEWYLKVYRDYFYITCKPFTIQRYIAFMLVEASSNVVT
jgi:hypothetical protein